MTSENTAPTRFTGYLLFHAPKRGQTFRLFVGERFFAGYAPDGTRDLDDSKSWLRRMFPGELQTEFPDAPRVWDEGNGRWWNLASGAPLYGVRSDRVRCDSRCTGARRSMCECQCGGENHGRLFSHLNDGGRACNPAGGEEDGAAS